MLLERMFALVMLAFTSHLSQAQSTLSLSSAVTVPNSTVTIDLTFQSTPGNEPASLQWAFEYAGGIVTGLTVTANPSLTAAGKVVHCSPGAGVYRCLATGINNTRIPNGVIANVSATVSGASGVAAINITNALGASPTATAASVTGTGGTVSVASQTNVVISGQVTTSGLGLSGAVVNVNGSQTLSAATDAFGAYRISVPINGTYTLSASHLGYGFSAPVAVSNVTSNQVVNFTGTAIPGLDFYPVTPCRVVDTRVSSFQAGFGPPSMAAGSMRSFALASSRGCPIPFTAAAYALNLTVVTKGYLGALSIWPTGQVMPSVSTLNSYSNTSTAVSNTVLVPAGFAGAINLYTTDTVDVILDINGYFAPPAAAGLEFYPVAPCRVVDTRLPAMQFGFGPPSLQAQSSRGFAIPSAVACGIPATAAAYSLNVTAIPQNTLGFLSIWPADKPTPTVSTLNVYTPGMVVANAAIVPAGTNGAISTYVTDLTDLVVDINGYFAAPGANSLKFYPVSPCRVADTRIASFPAGLGPDSIRAATQRTFPMTTSNCGIPVGAGAYSLNFTAVPRAVRLGVFTVWAAGQEQPNVSLLNSYGGMVVSNAAIVPAGVNGSISAYASDATDVLIDLAGYFAH